MQSHNEIPAWDFSAAIDLLKTLSSSPAREVQPPLPDLSEPQSGSTLVLSQAKDEDLTLGNFNKIWDFLESTEKEDDKTQARSSTITEYVTKEVRWRDEVSGADLEDNVDIEQDITAASLRTQKRAARRARARDRAEKAASRQLTSSAAASDSDADAESEMELNHIRRSPDRRAIIQELLHGHDRRAVDPQSPPTSPSPPKETLRILKKDWPISNPFQWSASANPTSSHRNQILPLGNLSHEERKKKLIARLIESFPEEKKYLRNKGLIHPEFTPLNTSNAGIHVFIDISNVRWCPW
jgi:hypothetical protein